MYVNLSLGFVERENGLRWSFQYSYVIHNPEDVISLLSYMLLIKTFVKLNWRFNECVKNKDMNLKYMKV